MGKNKPRLRKHILEKLRRKIGKRIGISSRKKIRMPINISKMLKLILNKRD